MNNTFVSFFCSAAVTGCASLPSVEGAIGNAYSEEPEIYMLAKDVGCKFKSLIKSGEVFVPVFDDGQNGVSGVWEIATDVSLENSRALSAGIDPISWLIPAGISSFGVGGNVSGSETRNITASVKYRTVPTTALGDCDQETLASINRRAVPEDYGIKKWFAQLDDSEYGYDRSQIMDGMSYAVSVTTVGSGSINAAISDTNTNPTRGISLAPSATITNTRKYTVTLGFAVVNPLAEPSKAVGEPSAGAGARTIVPGISLPRSGDPARDAVIQNQLLQAID